MSAILWWLVAIVLAVFGLILLAAIAWAALLVWVLRVESYDEPDDIDAPDEPVVDADDWGEPDPHERWESRW